MAEGHMEKGKFHPHNNDSENSVSSDQVVNQDKVESDLIKMMLKN